MLLSKGVLCKICFDALHHSDLLPIAPDSPIDFSKRSAMCSCCNVAVIWDEDVTPRIYVDDILTTQRCIVIHTHGEEIKVHLLKPFGKAIFTPLDFKDKPLLYVPIAEKNKYTRKTSTKYNTTLIAALDKYKYETSDGGEQFLRTSLNDPLKEAL